MANHVGLRDFPVEHIDNETLGLRQYASALSDFARQCETPMTIALQGDWGSGKTSLMNLIRAELAESNKNTLIWFNTWQYSQFGLQEELPLSLISYFMEQLEAPPETQKTVSRLKLGCRGFLNITGKVGAAVGGIVGGTIKGVAEVAGEAMADKLPEISDPGRDIALLKSQAGAAVERVVGADAERRVVVFIDDLDRLSPVKAVELLEAFKLFLEIPGCVYILACDYQVVSQGLKMKFGVGNQELKGKSFFDKIIQLPFQMPVTQYKVDNYIAKLLESINVEFADEDIGQYREMIETSIGFNPRNLKRAFNCLLLLNIVAAKEGVFERQAATAKKSEMQKVIFASICLQRAYEVLYVYLVKNADQIDDQLFARLMNENSYQQDKELADLLDLMQRDDVQVEATRLAHFMRTFYQAIQLSSDGDEKRLSDDEIYNLRALLTFAAVTSSGESSAEPASSELDWNLRRRNRRIASALAEYFNQNFSNLVEAVAGNPFKVYQAHGENAASVYVWHGGKKNRVLGYQFGLWLSGENYEAFIGSADEVLIEKSGLPQHLKSQLEAKRSDDLKNAIGEDNYFYALAGLMPSYKNTSEEEQIEFLKDVGRDYFSAIGELIASE